MNGIVSLTKLKKIMLIDVTRAKRTDGDYEYTMYMCTQPRHGVEENCVGITSIRHRYAIIYQEEHFFTCQLVPQHSMALKFADKYGKFNPIICKITSE